MKKITFLSLVLCLLFILTACGTQNTNKQNSSNEISQAQTNNSDTNGLCSSEDSAQTNTTRNDETNTSESKQTLTTQETLKPTGTTSLTETPNPAETPKPAKTPASTDKLSNSTIQIADVSFACYEYNLIKGKSVEIQTIIDPFNATETVSWTSSNTSIVTVNKGVIKAVGNGNAVVTATAPNGDTASCTVYVYTPVTGVTLEKNSYTVYRNKSIEISASVTPSDASNSRLTWSSSNSNIARVTNGTVIGVSNGTATITVSTEDGNFSKQCSVTVTDAPLTATYGLRHMNFIDGWKEGLEASVIIEGGSGNYSNYTFNIKIYHENTLIASANNISGNKYNSGWISVLEVAIVKSGQYKAVFEITDDKGNLYSGNATYSW